ncbi:MAG TPA: hypothetical protein PLP05_11345 [Sedimentisphaerales bacterium]|nr:hypothetical protein [Sedimentisphaerales bacterium]
MKSVVQTNNVNQQKEKKTPLPHVKEQLEVYFNSFLKNVKGDAFAIVQGHVLGALLLSGRPEYAEIAESYVRQCKEICNTGDLFKHLIDSGGDECEFNAIRIADNIDVLVSV